MAKSSKKQKTAGERSAQAARSATNKRNRLARNNKKGKNRTSKWYIRHLMQNRFRRLARKVRLKDLSAERRNNMMARLREISEITGQEIPALRFDSKESGVKVGA